MERTYRFRLYPKDSQIETMDRWLYLLHDLYNAGLQQRIMAYRNNRITQTYNKQQNELPELKEHLKEYKQIHSQVLQDSFRRLDKAYDSFFRRIYEKKAGTNVKAGFPRYKSLHRYHSFTYPQSGFQMLENGHLYLSGIGEVRMFKHRDVKGTIKTCTIKKDKVGDWWASFSVELPDPTPVHKESMTAIGIDLGLEKLATISSGETIERSRFTMPSEKRKKRLQRKHSRKEKRSNNREKARVTLAREEMKVERQRDDYIHKVSRKLSTRADVIIFEDLRIQNMVKNHHLAKAIEDASWGKLVQYTSYKVEETGGEVILVNPKNTSQTCSKCGGCVQKSLSERIHACPSCGFIADRDWNASLNILKIGWGTPEYTPVETEALPERATPVAETGSPFR